MKSKVITFGCRLNACESETIEEFVKELEIDDFTIINTCAVTAEAERKLRQTIRRLYNEDNKIKITEDNKKIFLDNNINILLTFIINSSQFQMYCRQIV